MACDAFLTALGIGIAGAMCVVLDGIFGWFVVPFVVRSKVADVIPLKNNSDSLKRWMDPPVPIYFNVYIFHVNNPDEILQGDIPEVIERGPYVYREKRVKKILSFNENNSAISYEQKLLFEFDQEASGNFSEDDVYTVANLQALALSQAINNLNQIIKPTAFVNTAMPKMWPSNSSNPLFDKVKVKDFLFGQIPMYCNQKKNLRNIDVRTLCSIIRNFTPKTIVLDGISKGINSFSLFRYKNNSEDGIYEIDIGLKDITQIGNIKRWNNKTMLSDWKANSCNKILGTDSTIFRPYLRMDGVDSLYIFNTDICRSVKLFRKGYINYKGVPGIRYATDKSTFGSVLEYSENYCYCPQSIFNLTHFGGCLKSGAIELSSCQKIPVFVSHPHFLWADSSYRKIKGLKADKSKHQAYVDLEFYTGYPLSAASRAQINIFLQSIEEVDSMKNLPNVLLPVVWLEEKMDLTDDLISEINAQLLNKLLIVDIVEWLLVGVGIFLILLSFFCCMRRNKTKNNEGSK